MKLCKRLTDFWSVVVDLVMALPTMLGQKVRQAILAIRIALYVLQAFFIVVGRGHGKAANVLVS